MEFYRKEIKESIENNDKIVSNDVFPTERRKWVVSTHCKVCGKGGKQDVNEFKLVDSSDITQESYQELAKNYHFKCYCSKEGLVELRCSKCSTNVIFRKQAKARSDYVCKDCRKKVPCKLCGRKISNTIFKNNNGLCDICKTYINAYCHACGAYIGERKAPKNGFHYICNNCAKKE